MPHRIAILPAVYFAMVLVASAQTPSSSASSETPDAPTAMEDARLGDHWTYELRDEVTGDIKATVTNLVTDVSASEINIRLEWLGSPNASYIVFNKSWDMISKDGWRFTPNDGTGVQMPLAVGKSWSFKLTEQNIAGGVSWKRSGTSKVVAQENLTTRAGTFDTFKIETSSQAQNSNDPTKKTTATSQTWYAPLINHWIKRTYVSRQNGRVLGTSTVELVEYGRR